MPSSSSSCPKLKTGFADTLTSAPFPLPLTFFRIFFDLELPETAAAAVVAVAVVVVVFVGSVTTGVGAVPTLASEEYPASWARSDFDFELESEFAEESSSSAVLIAGRRTTRLRSFLRGLNMTNEVRDTSKISLVRSAASFVLSSRPSSRSWGRSVDPNDMDNGLKLRGPKTRYKVDQKTVP